MNSAAARLLVSEPSEMRRVAPPSTQAVAVAGQVLSRPVLNAIDYMDAYATVSDWRWAHNVPMNAFYVGLKRNAHKVCYNPEVASRLKRFEAIEAKLRRFADAERGTRPLRLDRMQDIAGCRAVLNSCEEVDALVQLYKHPRTPFLSRLTKENPYIDTPRPSGYRSHHLIFEYEGRASRNAPFRGLRVELQLRSKLQHAWAAAVETVDLFLRQELKTGGGEEPWRRFFALMASFMAHQEGRPLVEGTPQQPHALAAALYEAEAELHVLSLMRGWRVAVEKVPAGRTKAPYLLLEIDIAAVEPQATVSPFYSEAHARAALETAEAKARGRQGLQVVIVKALDVKATRLAYPAYFADTQMFAYALSSAVGHS